MICLEDIDISKEASLDCCQHKYCYPCIQKWVKEIENSCPQCKQKIKKILFRDVIGREQSEAISDKQQEVDNFEDLNCEECKERIYERNFDARRQDRDFAVICEECLDIGKHRRCMTTSERQMWDIDLVWFCSNCIDGLSHYDSEDVEGIELCEIHEAMMDVIALEQMSR